MQETGNKRISGNGEHFSRSSSSLCAAGTDSTAVAGVGTVDSVGKVGVDNCNIFSLLWLMMTMNLQVEDEEYHLHHLSILLSTLKIY